MRKLIILRGRGATGKSSWVSENRLQAWTLELDTIRNHFQSPILTQAGGLHLSTKYNKQVREYVIERLRQRMARGETTIIDDRHETKESIHEYKALCEEFRYDCYLVQFGENESIFNPTYWTAMMRTSPDFMLEIMKGPAWIENHDLNEYKRLCFIGDIQGCFDPLAKFFINESKRLAPQVTFHNPGKGDKLTLCLDTAYIFCGDLTDRGPQNAEVVQFALSLATWNNVFFIEGNHEKWLWHWAIGKPIDSIEFVTNTQPQLEGWKVDKAAMRTFCKESLLPYMIVRFDDAVFFVTHGGIGKIPANFKDIPTLNLIATDDLIRGTGKHKDDIDSVWNNNHDESEQTFQVHGHRNHFNREISESSINLEGGVEFGGALRVFQVEQTPKVYE